MTEELQDRVAVVTGASKGIGLAVARTLAGAGARVVAASRGGSAELDALVEKYGARSVRADLSDPRGVAALAEAAGDRVDILVNNVGYAPARPGGFLSITDEQWRTSIDRNLLVAVAVTRAILPLMLDTGRGSIVSIGSVNAVFPDPLVIDYSAGKAALVNFSKALSKEFGGRGIRVNTVSPGPVETDLWLGGEGVAATVSEATGMSPAEVRAQATGAIVSGRFSRPDEVAELVLLLASDRAANVLGSDFTIDGGFVTTT
ncbi:SDR family oxidoreductase [Streptomyces sp. NBC_01476]|uniref:SDR family oxidoreductase n=1 Tax=Streptomyces sp. NBC_01476 TaxID=2903881 RepID=UPI002E327598|nr:SDR family oxidoreductase [Streptomyces sp. NBC_01476]